MLDHVSVQCADVGKSAAFGFGGSGGVHGFEQRLPAEGRFHLDQHREDRFVEIVWCWCGCVDRRHGWGGWMRARLGRKEPTPASGPSPLAA